MNRRSVYYCSTINFLVSAGMENSDESGTAMMLSCREETTPLLTQPDKGLLLLFNQFLNKKTNF